MTAIPKLFLKANKSDEIDEVRYRYGVCLELPTRLARNSYGSFENVILDHFRIIDFMMVATPEQK